MLIYLEVLEREREGETQWRKLFNQLICSPNGWNSWAESDPRQKLRASPGYPRGAQGFQIIVPLCCSPSHISSSLRAAAIPSRTPEECQGHSWWLYLLHHHAGIRIRTFKRKLEMEGNGSRGTNDAESRGGKHLLQSVPA